MENVLSLFHPETARWFSEAVGEPTRVQQEAWPAIAAGESVLVSAPTGTGKTLSAFLVLIDRLKAEARAGALTDGLHVLYISPLKSLAADIRENLDRPLEGIGGPALRTGVRTGDTTAAERQRQLRHPPHIFITTPESLYILLTTRKGREMLSTARAVVIDELHALISGKRGAHLMLSLARLDAVCGHRLQRIGLSATIRPLELAAEYLAPGQSARVIAPKMEKRADIDVNGVLGDMRVLPEGSIWPELARKVLDHCEGRRTVIAFLEGRAAAERLAGAVNALAEEYGMGEDFARTHHGSVSREKRQEAEDALRRGELRLLCATSSMELGIDVGEVDLVLQIGCPLSVSSALQRMGRAGHNPGRVSVMHIFPRTAADGLYCGLTAQTALEGCIEPAHPPRQCLDVLAQHLVSMAADGGYTVDEALEIARNAWPTKDLTRDDLCGVLEMLAGDWEHEQDKPARPRLLYDRLHGAVLGDGYTRLLALSAGGTIPDRGLYPAYLHDGTRVGELDEEFVFEARVGDKFLLGAFAWRLDEIHRDRVIVSPASAAGAQAPFWRGDGVGRAYEVSLRFGELLRGLERHPDESFRAMRMDEFAAFNAERYVREQVEATGCLPDDRTIIVEHFADEQGDHQLMVHSIFGDRVNYGLALLLQHAAESALQADIRAYDDDNGALLYLIGERDFPDGLLQSLDPDSAGELLTAMLPATPLFFLAFRYNAGRALLMGARSGHRQPLWVQRLRGAEVLGAVAGEKRHPLMQETLRECLEDYLDLNALREVISGVRSGRIAVRELHLAKPSPMSLPMRRQVEAELLYDYSPIPSAARRVSEAALQASAARRAAQGIAPAADALEAQFQRRRAPEDAEQLHSLLMTEGDVAAGEVDAPIQWLEALLRAGRCLYVEPGLWIAAEEADLYRRALAEGDEAARLRLTRRCLRYRGGQDAEALFQRYGWPVADSAALLEALAADGVAVPLEGIYYHRDVYDRAQRQTVQARRQEIRTLPPERYAALLARGLRRPGPAEAQLREGLNALLGRAFPLSQWEGQLLPARVNGYKAQLLDACVAGGELFWQIDPQEEKLAFYPMEDIDWDAPPLWEAAADALDEEERAVLTALSRRGASFSSALVPLVKRRAAIDVLQGLAARGLVRSDSFVPLRTLETRRGAKNLAPRQLANMRAFTAQAGRWELARPVRAYTDEELLLADFREMKLVCRETVRRLSWSRALEILRVWEYTGRARRGYFVSGLSGIQFVRAEDYAAVIAGLNDPGDDAIWLHANDPAQAWGGALPHAEGRSFLAVPGTAVCLLGGRVVAALERSGASLRIFEPACAERALAALAGDFRRRNVFPGQKRLILKKAPAEVHAALEKAGFLREALDWVLWPDGYR